MDGQSESTPPESHAAYACNWSTMSYSQLEGNGPYFLNRSSLFHGDIQMQQVKDVMKTDVQVIGPEATLAQAAQSMRDGDFGLMPVGENDRMIGTISDRDITVRAVAEGKSGNTKVREVMSGTVRWVYADESVDRASAIMSEHQVRRLPVVDRDKRLVGILALGDLALNKAQLQPAAKALSEISQPPEHASALPV
ncbi:MAG TPA: CBS domain-containing protein [Burkholderiaceae bacterium]|nr:CBS domain-containing protein [Burkholderiaceae bacterium]